jgi:hypothetical protein
MTIDPIEALILNIRISLEASFQSEIAAHVAKKLCEYDPDIVRILRVYESGNRFIIRYVDSRSEMLSFVINLRG